MEPPLPLRRFEMCAIRKVKAVADPLTSVVVDALVEIGRDLQGSNDSGLVLALRRGCGRMEDLAPENDFKRG
jgi:hypothetical protein